MACKLEAGDDDRRRGRAEQGTPPSHRSMQRATDRGQPGSGPFPISTAPQQRPSPHSGPGRRRPGEHGAPPWSNLPTYCCHIVFELAMIVACESGRPLRRAWSEVRFAVDYVRILAAQMLPSRQLDRPGLRIVLNYKALGVVGAIAPWNGPVVLAVAKIANALIVGDTIILRPLRSHRFRRFTWARSGGRFSPRCLQRHHR